MIEVGIQDNIMVTGALLRKDPKGNPLKESLVVELEIAGAKDDDIMDSLLGAEESSQDGNDQEYYFWPIDDKDKDGVTVDLKEILKRIKDFKAQLNHILSAYMVKSAIETKWNAVLFHGTGIVPENIEQLLTQPEILNRVYLNIAGGFIELITPFIGTVAAPGPQFRVKFVRQNEKKHFSRIPKFSPFWEPMTIPKAQSKLAYSKWEKKNGYDSGVPSDDLPTADSEPDKDEQKAVDEIFGVSDKN